MQQQQEVSPSANCCCICLAAPAPGDAWFSLDCRHRFHATCIQRWLCRGSTCPVCRTEVSVGRRNLLVAALTPLPAPPPAPVWTAPDRTLDPTWLMTMTLLILVALVPTLVLEPPLRVQNVIPARRRARSTALATLP